MKDRDGTFFRPHTSEVCARRALVLLQEMHRFMPHLSADDLDEVASDMCERLYGTREYGGTNNPFRFGQLSIAIKTELNGRGRQSNG